MIEAAKCIFHKLLEEVKDDLDRVTPQSQEGLCTEIKQNKQRCSRTVILKVNPCPRPEESSEKSVHQVSTETPVPQSSAGIPEQAFEDDRNFRMYSGPGSDGSSADKLSLDLKFKPWDTAITFRPEWRSMSKTVFTHYDPFEPWYTEQSGVWLDDVKTFDHRPMRCVIVVQPYSLAQED